MLKVGLTGSIAVGKSYVCEILRELGAFVLDADRTAREVVAPGTRGWQLIVDNFGKDVLQSDNTINRAKLGALVFADEGRRQLLNSIVHPLVIEAQNDWLNSIEENGSSGGGSIAVIDAALMIESGGYRRFDKLVVVWCEAETQIKRLTARNNLSRAEALQRIDAQMTQEEKKRFADFLIDTTGGFEAARRQTVEVFGQLKLLVD